MNARQRFWTDDPGWENPTPSATPRPYLADQIFPAERGSATDQEAIAVLKRFYCASRPGASTDSERLLAFLREPDEQLFVIEGEVGVGKTWFLRYHLDVLALEWQDKATFGVIDMLRAAPDDAKAVMYRQLAPILDGYFAQHFGGTQQALRLYATQRARLRLGCNRNLNEIRTVAEQHVTRWIEMDANDHYCAVLLAVLEHLDGPMLFIAVDNIDRLTAGDQERLLDLVQRALRNSRIRLIVPLRTTSSLLRDRFRGLNEVRYESMFLSPLSVVDVLEMRFSRSKKGDSLSNRPSIVDGTRNYTFPKLWKRISGTDAGELLVRISGGNCRVALRMVKQLLESNRLRSLEHLGNVQYAIEAWMLTNSSEPSEAAAIINLFDNEEGRRLGNGLVRYRVLEYFLTENEASPTNKHFEQHFDRLGYDRVRIARVLSRLLMASLITSRDGLDPARMEQTTWENLGVFAVTPTGRAYEDILLRKQWYFIVAKRGAARNLPSDFLSYDSVGDYFYVTHTNFVEFLRSEERDERERALQWDRKYASGTKRQRLGSPAQRAHSVLKGAIQ